MIVNVLKQRTGGFRFAILGLLLASCASQDPIKLDSAEHLQVIEKDWESLYPDIQPASGEAVSLTIHQAISRALQHNLDARVAALETLIAKDNVSLAQFEGAPNITASGTFTRRNNLAASSSESILTGTQSLEPSTSSEQSRRLADIKAQWNVLDSVIAYLEGKNAGDQETIAKERLRKVQQNIERDVISAYWQAYAGEESEKEISGLSSDIARLEKSIQTALEQKLLPVDGGSDRMARLLGQQGQLNDLYQVTSLSKAELKAITALPTGVDVALISSPKSFDSLLKKSLKNKEVDGFVKVALQNRPELRESMMNVNISVRGVERELLTTFPGLNLIYGRSYDSNRFLNESAWTDLTGAITQSITDFISLPTRYNAAQNREELEKVRRKALTAAIVAQVHIAQIRIGLAQANYNLAQSDYKISKKQAYSAGARNNLGAASGYDATVAKASVMAKKIEKNQAYAELQKAYIDMIGTIGLSLYDLHKGQEELS